ncbi:EpsD family peptidyl-prolyl cis-trans isomerase [Rhodoferax saidenbachensis]|uniref:peptidylprolyl isomerase n=1 Tax=Rhodoferax saidenbachensis TaxID=1484693 RepID=A0ABU1ZJ84_9BURK|nr:EpsD family peptidyl-prolyl cis-trans isomerase [Rhodoferax saidenbachensis]MDR7305615.1 EpsD family peptidyl-prolyl cis-trans isomerase [Rhodoferax saidenbachensis]
MTTTPTRFSATLLTIALVFALAACGNKEDKKIATQVAAKVGSEEISVHQINQVLSRTSTNGANQETVQKMGREVLEKLIDQQLAVDQATENKLQRSPEVVAQIEAARRDILARAYIQQITSNVSKPTEEETKKYFIEHPQLFSERRVYNVQEIVVPNAPGLAEQLRPLAAAGKPIEDTASLLKSKNIQFGGGSATRAAEQIPLEILPRIHALKDGQSTLIETPQNLTLLRVVSSQSAPIPQEAALPRIEQFLMNQRAGEAVTANIKQLRSSTQITYMGDFSKPDENSSTTDSPSKSTIEKGVAGLK